MAWKFQEKTERKIGDKKLKILIIRMSSFGDVLLTTPVIKAFKNKYPEVQIDFLVLENFKAAIKDFKGIDNLIIFDKKKNDGFKNILKFADKLKENNYDYIFDLHSKLRSKLISKRLNVKTFTYKKRAFWKTILVKSGLIKYKVDDTIVRNYFNAFKGFDLEYCGEDIEFNYGDNSKFLEYKSLPMMAPGASKETKKWPLEYFGELAKLIYQKHNLKTVLIGGKEDIERCEEINKISGNNCINLAGKLSLKESGAVLSLGKFLVTNDSGPFHIGRGVKIPTFVIFGPTSPGMFELGKRDTLIYANVSCSPCSLHGDKICPKKNFRCMKEMTSEKVLEIIDKKIEWED